MEFFFYIDSENYIACLFRVSENIHKNRYSLSHKAGKAR